jgi:hypothetical protein
VRVDAYLDGGLGEQDVDRWVQSASILHSNGDALDIAVKDDRIVGGPGPVAGPGQPRAAGAQGPVRVAGQPLARARRSSKAAAYLPTHELPSEDYPMQLITGRTL